MLLLFLNYFIRDLKLLRHSHQWLKTKGQITQCELIKQGHTYWPRIEYHYTINDREFTGHYFFVDTSLNNPNSRYARELAYRIINAYNKGEEVDIYYDPNKPTVSALDVTIPKKLYLILGLIFLLITVHLFLIGAKLI